MSAKIAQKFEVPYVQVLDEEGNVNAEGMPEELHEKAVKEMYGLMVLARKLDEKMVSLQRQGKLGTFAPVRGHEAVQIGSVYAKETDDWVFPYFRQWAAFLAVGYPMEMILQYNAGDERGMMLPKGTNIFPVNIPVGSQIPHAVGFAWGQKLKKNDIAALCYLGDGATSKGDFHEGLNFAGVFQVPVVFICENNQYAISVPRSRQSASATLAQKAVSYGFDGIQVDGNDVFAMYKVTKEALANAREGKPALIEAVTYRLENHTTADDATKYRSEKEVELWKKKDPLVRLKKYVERELRWSAKDEEKLQAWAEKKIADAISALEKIPEADSEEIFKYQYAQMTPALEEQWKDVFGKGDE